MGQRLVISIQNNGKELATVYYHWSAYTVSALWEASKLVKCIFNHKDETEYELKLRLIRFCEENGGGINNNEEEFKSELHSFYQNSEKYQLYCENAKSVFDENRGAINYVIERI